MNHTKNLAKHLDNEFIYTKAGTCITTRWRTLGWVPASEVPEIQDKWAMYRNMPIRTLDSGF